VTEQRQYSTEKFDFHGITTRLYGEGARFYGEGLALMGHRTIRLNQDPLENFFGCIRQQGGNCDTPTTIQFTRAFRKLFYDNYLSPSNTNCAADLDAMLFNAKTPERQQSLLPVMKLLQQFRFRLKKWTTNYHWLNKTL
jgi:hypothetical protein